MSIFRFSRLDDLPLKMLEKLYDPLDFVIDCTEHQNAGDNEVFPNCPACHRATMQENLVRARSAKSAIIEYARQGLSSPESWHKAAADIPMWEDLLNCWSSVQESYPA